MITNAIYAASHNRVSSFILTWRTLCQVEFWSYANCQGAPQTKHLPSEMSLIIRFLQKWYICPSELPLFLSGFLLTLERCGTVYISSNTSLLEKFSISLVSTPYNYFNNSLISTALHFCSKISLCWPDTNLKEYSDLRIGRSRSESENPLIPETAGVTEVSFTCPVDLNM